MLKVIKAVVMLTCFLAASLHAQQALYPSRPIKLVVPFAPAGIVDLIARPIAAKLAEQLGQSVVVENRPGAGGRIGTTNVLMAPTDGYTLLLSGSPLTIGPSVYLSAKWDVAKDFEPVALIGEIPNAIIVADKSSFKTLRQVVEAAKENPGVYNFSSLGVETVTSLAIEMLWQAAGIQLTPISYGGNPAAQLALIRGDIHLMATSIALVNAEAGDVRPLAATSARRSQRFPNVPTVAEIGFPGYEAITWYGVFAPRGTSPAVVERLNVEIAAVVRDPQVQKFLIGAGMDVDTKKPAEFRSFLQADQRRWAHVLQAAGIKPQ